MEEKPTNEFLNWLNDWMKNPPENFVQAAKVIKIREEKTELADRDTRPQYPASAGTQNEPDKDAQFQHRTPHLPAGCTRLAGLLLAMLAGYVLSEHQHRVACRREKIQGSVLPCEQDGLKSSRQK